MAPLDLHGHVNRLLEYHPRKAVDILVTCCNDYVEVREEVLGYLAGNETRLHGESSSSGRVHVENTSSVAAAPSQLFAAAPSRERAPHRRPSFVGSVTPLSPPRSEASQSSNNRAKPGEYILLLVYAGDEIQAKPVRMRTAPIEHSVIREDVVSKRLPTCSLDDVEECYVSVTHAGTHVRTEVPTSHSVELTWLRPNSESTHSTTFHVVPRTMLDTDVLLGYLDSGEDIVDQSTSIPLQPQFRQNYAAREYNQSTRPPAPMPPSQSFHRSANESSIANPVPRQEHSDGVIETLLSRQRANAATQDERRGSHKSSSTIIQESRSIHANHQQMQHPSAIPTNSTTANHPDSVTDRVRLRLLWDKTLMSIWLNLCTPGEAFFETFQQLVEKRKGIFDRNNIILSLKKDESIPDSEAYHLSLEKEDLEADWETTLEWLNENKRDKPPHIYARVQIGEE